MSESPTPTGNVYRLLGFIPLRLEEGVRNRHVNALYFGAFFSIGLLTFINVQQGYLFTNLGIPESEWGGLAGGLLLLNELVVLATVYLLGTLSDRIGRRGVYALGFSMVGICYVLYPMATTAQHLFLSRPLFAFGAACISAMLASVINDYPEEASRSRFQAAAFILNGIGISVVNGMAGRLIEGYKGLGLESVMVGRATFWTAAAACLVVAVVLIVFLKPGAPAQVEKREGLFKTAGVAFRAARNPRVGLAYIGALVSRGDLAVVSVFYSLWLRQVGMEQGLTSEEAQARAVLFYIVAQAFAVPWAAIMAPILDRIDRVAGIAIAMFLAACGYLSMPFFPDPISNWMFLGAALIGMGEMCAQLSAIALIGKEAPVRGRGSVIGLFSFFGALGIMGSGVFGGWLFDHWESYGPFVMVGCGNVVVFSLALILLRREARRRKAQSALVANS
ncbi:MAG: MFS transporter [Gammaproteobacteria bacterium]|nr:MFS transporter [Gammaproteobacteria bacterium]